MSTSSNNVSLYFTLVSGDGGGKIASSTAELISPDGLAGGSFLHESAKNPIDITQKILVTIFLFAR
jgi:hypothetical protein